MTNRPHIFAGAEADYFIQLMFVMGAVKIITNSLLKISSEYLQNFLKISHKIAITSSQHYTIKFLQNVFKGSELRDLYKIS